MTVEQEIQQLEDKKKKLLEQKKNDEKTLKIAKNRLAVGKYFKRCHTWRWNNKAIGASSISYLYIKDFVRYSDGKIMYDEAEGRFTSESFSIKFSPAGWVFKEGNLSIQTGNNGVSVQVRKHYGTDRIEAGVDYGNTSCSAENIEEGKLRVGDAWYTECTREEYFKALDFSINYANEFSEKAKKFFSDSYYKPIAAKEEGVFQMDYSVIQKYNDLLEFTSKQKVSIESLMQAGGKVRKYNYFNGTKLEELVQYSRSSEVGINLDIQSGDDGTDYEPYTTHYYIGGVSLDWLTILYPIRTKLDSVQKTASDLYTLKSVYLTSNWDCEYDTSAYDATFRCAKLKDFVLQQVNQVIQKHVK